MNIRLWLAVLLAGSVVMNLRQLWRGREVEEGRWGKEELDGAEEIFLTNARIGITSVRSWRGKRLGMAEVAAGLRKAFGAE